ncbi:MAG: alpha/beta fold hydrolase [Pseudomonadales bacterium]
MIKFLKWFLIVIVVLILIPPLWFTVFPEAPKHLPEAGNSILLSTGSHVNVLDQGTGPAVVLVHGLPGSAYDWRELTPLLNRAGIRTIAYDRVGYGRSDPRANTNFSLLANSDELGELLQALELDEVTVVGWSYGGAMAMQAASNSRIARLVLVGTGGPSSEDDAPPEPSAAIKMLYSMPVLRWRSAVPPVSRALQSVLSDTAFSGGPQPDWWKRDLAANFSRWDTVLTYRNEILAEIEADGFDPALIQQPTLIVHGEDDQLAPVAIGRYLAKAIPAAVYEEMPGASHMLPITHASQLSEQIAAFARSD